MPRLRQRSGLVRTQETESIVIIKGISVSFPLLYHIRDITIPGAFQKDVGDYGTHDLLFWFVGETVREFEVDGRTHVGANDEEDSEQDERNAEPLAHVERHVGLERNLIVLYEFDEETACKQHRQENAEQQSGAFLGILFPVEPHQQSEQGEIAKGLVDLCRVRRVAENRILDPGKVGSLVKNEAESPWKVGSMAVDFGIEEISKTDERAGQCYRGHDAVECP